MKKVILDEEEKELRLAISDIATIKTVVTAILSR